MTLTLLPIWSVCTQIEYGIERLREAILSLQDPIHNKESTRFYWGFYEIVLYNNFSTGF